MRPFGIRTAITIALLGFAESAIAQQHVDGSVSRATQAL